MNSTARACKADRELAAKNGLNITGSGVLADPALPLNSLNTIVDGETDFTSAIPLGIETSQRN